MQQLKLEGTGPPGNPENPASEANEPTLFEKTDRRGRRITLAFTEEGRIRVKREDETLRITGADEAERRLGYYASPEVRANPSYMAIGDVVLTPRERRTLTERFDEEKRKREQEAE